MAWLIVLIGVVVVVAVVVYFMKAQHPENAATHGDTGTNEG